MSTCPRKRNVRVTARSTKLGVSAEQGRLSTWVLSFIALSAMATAKYAATVPGLEREFNSATLALSRLLGWRLVRFGSHDYSLPLTGMGCYHLLSDKPAETVPRLIEIPRQG